MSDELTIHRTHLDGSALLTLHGEIDMSTAPMLTEALQQVAALRLPVLLDMAGVSFMDSSGINALLDAPILSEGLVVRIRKASPAVQQVLRISGIAPLLLADD